MMYVFTGENQMNNDKNKMDAGKACQCGGSLVR